MDASLRLRSVQHDKVVSFRTLFFVIPSAFFFVIPSACEEFRAMWMLHCAQHDKMVDASLCFAPFSMTVHLAGE